MKKVIAAGVLIVAMFIIEVSAAPRASTASAHQKQLTNKIADLAEFAADYGYEAAKNHTPRALMQFKLKKMLRELSPIPLDVKEDANTVPEL